MANVNITGIQIGDNTYYPRRVYEANVSLDIETGNRGFNISDCRPIDGLSIIIRFKDLILDETDNYNGIKYVWTDLGLIPIKYMNINQPYLYFNEHDMAEFVFRGSGDSSVCELVSYPHNMIPITYSNLKTERDNGKLIPGMKYRIIDYVTQCYYTATSSEHPFDIVVTAIDNHTLDENAKAMKRDGDEYFANCDLNKWEIKYTLDADPNRFEWANSGEYAEPIYYLRDEYSITNISTNRFKDYSGRSFEVYTGDTIIMEGRNWYRTTLPNTFIPVNWSSDSFTYCKEYVFSGGVVGKYTFVLPSTLEEFGVIGVLPPKDSETFQAIKNGVLYDMYIESYGYNPIDSISWYQGVMDGRFDIYDEYGDVYYGDTDNGTIDIFGKEYYRLVDDNNNIFYVLKTELESTVGNIIYFYEDYYETDGTTISNIQPITKGIIYHMKDEYGNECPYDFKNIMFKPKGYEEHTFNINFHTFAADWGDTELSVLGKVRNNIIKPYVDEDGIHHLNNIVICHHKDVHSNIRIYDNYFDEGCRNMTFMDYFGPYIFSFYKNVFGKNCYFINKFEFGNTSSGIIVYSNTFGNECNNIYCASGNFVSNTFGSNCYSIYLGGYIVSNTFLDSCSYIYMGKSCMCNNFGKMCNSIKFWDNCDYNNFGNNVSYCYLKKTKNSSDNNYGDYFRQITFNNKVYRMIIYSSSTSSSYRVQNIVVTSDCNDSTWKYFNAGSNYGNIYTLYRFAPSSSTVTT